jgi:HK97 family phage portal protein
MNANSYVYRPAGAPELGEVGEAKLKQSLRDKRGADQSWLMAVLEEGTEIKTYGYSAEQMQLIDARKFNVLEVCRIFRLPPHKLQAFETGASFASVQVANDDYYVSSIRPWLVRLENRMNLCLLTPAERQVYYVEHDVKGILRADIKTRFDAYAVARQWGWMSANGVLRAENEPPIGPAGDVFLSPSNMADASQIPQLTADLAAQAAGRQALGSGQQGG